MPKKWKEDTRGAKAKEQKASAAAAKDAAKRRKEREAADEFWAEGANSRAEQKKRAAEEKAQAKAERAREKQELLAQEADELAKLKVRGSDKVAVRRTKRVEASAADKAFEQLETHFASTIDDAISVLDTRGEASGGGGGGGSSAGLDKHPERRAKAAYKAFEERVMPTLKTDFPGLRLSQYKQMLSKMWQKSSENPLNQEHAAYNTK